MGSKQKRLKDPIYGYIDIPVQYIREIVDTALFQRLRRIIQTSYSPLYSSAVHNRFVHSLGVYHLGTIAVEQLIAEIEKAIPFEKEKLQEKKKIFCLACLLHDVGHAPFSHTGESFYLENSKYDSIHEQLRKAVNSESFSSDIPQNDSNAAAPHEIMSVLVGIREFSDFFDEAPKREFFARCITGYRHEGKNLETSIDNCFIELLNSKVIDVDKLDYLIRDAYITGFHTVNIDYIRLLKAITVVEDSGMLQFAYYKDAISVIENVVYAHDAERKWIQTHPVVLYESYLLQHVFQNLGEELDSEAGKLFSYQSLTVAGHKLKNVPISLLSDDDIVYLMKNIYKSEYGKEFFERTKRRHPVWKSEAEYEALFSGVIGQTSREKFEEAMEATAKYLEKNSSSNWLINNKTIELIKEELKGYEVDGEKDTSMKKSRIMTSEVQKKEKESIHKLMLCLENYSKEHNLEFDFVVLSASQFISGFNKPDFSKIPIVFNTSEHNYISPAFSDVANPLKGTKIEKNKFYYLFYRRNKEEEIDKRELCEYLAKEFTEMKVHERRK